MIQFLGLVSDPADTMLNLHKLNLQQHSGESCAYFQFNHCQYYSDNETKLISVVCYANKNQLRVAISADHESIQRAIQIGEKKRDAKINDAGGENEFRIIYDRIVAETGIADIDLLSPLRLNTVTIPKPWGQEIWYTGIEERGVCSVQGVPLPWILELVGPLLTGTKSLSPILLKILDPLPQEITGDLYFELHQEKREVYIVTHVDKTAWPDSVGKIRYGFNPEKIDSYENEQQFKSAYLASVNEYKNVRQEIDLNPAENNPELEAKEESLRKAMDEYTSLKSLRVGDVIQVQPFTPHSLQHGVRVIEFQTPHFERFILSFAQKVLTQDHWDTEEAVQCVRFSEPDETNTPEDESLIADFEEFSVTRLALEPGIDKFIEGIEGNVYSLIIGVQGEAKVNNMLLLPEEGFYIPACVDSLTISNTGTDQATILIARPTA